MSNPKRVASLAEMKQLVVENDNILLCSYSALTHSQLTLLRRKVRDVGGRLMVTKNTLLRISLDDNNRGGLTPLLEGPTITTFTNEDPASVAKALSDFSNEFKTFQLKGGLVGEEILDSDKMTQLSRLPTRLQLMGQLAGLTTRPVADIAISLNEIVATIARCLDQIAAKSAA